MSTIFNHTTEFRRSAATDGVWIGHIIRRCWKALQNWETERAAFAQLSGMSDRELRDIGLNRSELSFAVKGQLEHLRRRGS